MGQPTYTENLVSHFSMQNAKTCKTPVNPSLKLTKAKDDLTCVDGELYQPAVGKPIYLSTRTRPDIAFAVSNIAKFTATPTEQHWRAGKHIFRYLVGTTNFGLQFTRNRCTGYLYADWAGDINDGNSTSGYLFIMSEVPVSWSSKKQSCIALSTAEAEYMSLTSAAQETIYLNCLLVELQKESITAAIINEHNQSAICMTKNPAFHGRSKHIAIKYHFIRDEVKKRKIDVQYCKTEDMIADMLTKGLYAERFIKLREMAGVKELHQQSDIK